MKNNKEYTVYYFNQGYEPYQIAEMLKLKPKTIQAYLNRHAGIKFKDGVKASKATILVNTTDHNYFSEINSDIKAYLYGFLLADGNLLHLNGKTRHRITLKLKDIEPLHLLKNELKVHNKIIHNSYVDKRTDKTYSSYSISIHSKKIYKDLQSYGMESNKTSCEKAPKNINKIYNRAIIRGILDGDGYVSRRDWKTINICEIGFTIGYDVNNWIKNTINNKLKLDVGTIREHCNTSKLVYRGINCTSKIATWLLENNTLNEIALSKKTIKLKELKEYEKPVHTLYEGVEERRSNNRSR